MSRLFIAAAVLSSTAFSADPAGFSMWRSSELKAHSKTLSGKMSPQKVASETLANYGNHLTMIARREGPGEAEIHDKMADIFVVQSGEATLVVGGTLVNSKSTGPGELRAPSIQGGSRHKLTAGDVCHIPAAVAHQLLIDNGKEFTYFVVKVQEK